MIDFTDNDFSTWPTGLAGIPEALFMEGRGRYTFCYARVAEFSHTPIKLWEHRTGICTYIIKSEKTGLYKIGRTKEIWHRLCALKYKTGDSTLKYEAIIPIDIEKYLHGILAAFAKGGEWFNLEEYDINRIKERFDFIDIPISAQSDTNEDYISNAQWICVSVPEKYIIPNTHTTL